MRHIRRAAIAFIAALVIITGAVLVGPVTSAAAAPLGCNGEEVQKRPYFAPPLRAGQRIDFGYAEWHFPPSCRDDLRRAWVKVYKVKAGAKDPKVYSTRGNRPYTKTFKDGKYRVKVRWEWRYYNAKTGKHSAWRGDTVTRIVRVR